MARGEENRCVHSVVVSHARWMRQGRRICCAVAAAILLCAAAPASADAAGASILEVHPQDVNWIAQVSSLRAGTVLFNAGKYTGCGISINAGRGSYLRPARAATCALLGLCCNAVHVLVSRTCPHQRVHGAVHHVCDQSVCSSARVTRHSCRITVHGVDHAR